MVRWELLRWFERLLLSGERSIYFWRTSFCAFFRHCPSLHEFLKDEQKGKKRLEKTDHFWIAWWLDDCFEIFLSYLWLSKIKIHSKLVIQDTEWENDWNFAVTRSPSLHISFIEASSSENWGWGCSVFQGACWEQGSTNVAWMRDLSQKGRRGKLIQRPWDWEVGETKLIDRDIHTVYTLMYLWCICAPYLLACFYYSTILARHR